MATTKRKPQTRPNPPSEPVPPTPEEPGADGAAPPPYSPSFPIVGIGASAGGLEAFTQLLKALPDDTGMGFVLIQHLSPDRASLLPELLARATGMPVAQVEGEPAVQPNHVYVIPPGLDMCVSAGKLELVPRATVRGHHHPIDQFLRSLAEDQAHCAIGVILSGTANDGTLGLEEIKAAGGITFAQDDSAQQVSMPQSAAATGCVDFVLSPQGIAEELVRISQHPLTAPEVTADSEGNAKLRQFGRVLKRLSSVTGVDFTRYKASTLSRRILRRMALHKIPDPQEYEQFMQDRPEEVEALYEDVLIHVTRFFRDPEVFEAIKADYLLALFRNRAPQEPVRVWVVGCSSGEEAYSLAILCAEAAQEVGSKAPLQLFASDLSARMIHRARLGFYPATIEADVSPERLHHYFMEESGGYRVSRAIRDSCVFAPHNVLTDPPFSRMDVVSCRNLLIYMEPVLQQKVLPLLHYALRPSGVLLLGKSETMSVSAGLFKVDEGGNQVFSRLPGGESRLAVGQTAPAARPGRPAPGLAARTISAQGTPGEVQREADRILAARYAPPGVLVSEELEVLQFWGDTSHYLTPMPGRATLNVLRMARPGTLVALRTAIEAARNTESAARHPVTLVPQLSAASTGLEVVRISQVGARPGGFLILFGETDHGTGARRRAARPTAHSADDSRVDQLEREADRLSQELEGTRDYLQAMIEQEQAINQELQSATEEAQSANEELQSINEELETSKEEIQATNEELTTVNDELNGRNEDLHRISNDWFNLLESVEVPIIILGRDLGIRRYSPVAGDVLRLIPADLGRPIGDVNLGLHVEEGHPLEHAAEGARLTVTLDLVPIVEEVLRTLECHEREVRRNDRWYLLRVRPYHTLDKKVEGAVLVFLDVNTLKRAQQYAEAIVSSVHEPLLVLDHDLRIRTANPFFLETFHVTAAETEGRYFFGVGRGHWDRPELRRLLSEVLENGLSFEDFLVEGDFHPIGHKVMLLNARQLPGEAGTKPQILLVMGDNTAAFALQSVLRQRVDELAAADRAKNEFLAMLGHELRNPLAPVLFANEILARRVQGDPVEQQCRLIERQIRQMGRLLDDLLEGSKVSQGMISLNRVEVDLALIVSNAVNTAAMGFELRRQELSYHVLQEPVPIMGDPVRLNQIVSNVLNNASKYTEPGGKIDVRLDTEPNKAVLRVRDNGIGIAPELLPRVFDLFTQGERSLDRSQGGLGIGLALVKNLMALHGGTAEVRSAGLGHGSEFTLRFPLLKAPVSAREPRQPLSDSASSVHGKEARALPSEDRPRILVVDDNRDNADTMVELGEVWGYHLRAAYDGPSAIDVALEFHPDVVLLDIGLPGMDGLQVARRLRQEPSISGVRLVALTGYGGAADRENSRNAGFDHHLTKPVDPRELEQLLTWLLESRA